MTGGYDHHLAFHQQNTNRATPNGGGGGNSNRRERERLRDEDCFDDGNEVGEDFDFERNLALFDKKVCTRHKLTFDTLVKPFLLQTVFNEIDDELSSNQPDLVRLVDCNRRKPEPKYRNDENVLVAIPAKYRQIETGEDPPPGEYVTDDGLVVPAVSLLPSDDSNSPFDLLL